MKWWSFRRGSWSIRTYLALGVNVPLVIAALVFLTLDYQGALNRSVAAKRVALDEEARVLLSAIELCSRDDPAATEQFINLACSRMQEATSPGHHIAVRLGNTVVQALAHHRASPEYLHAMEHAAARDDHVSDLDGREIVVGVAGHGEIIVYVSEYVVNVIRAIRFQLLMRFLVGVGVTVVILIVINVILARVVIRPLRQMSTTVRRIGDGDLGLQVPPAKSYELQRVRDSINEMSRVLAESDGRRQAQMGKARDIQRNLQPDLVKPIGFSLHYLSQPADDVGGDFLDYHQADDGRLIICVADVTGHGVPAAMGAAMLKVLFDAAIEGYDDPADIVAAINQPFHRVALEGDFATAAVICLDPRRQECRYASAGHEPIVLLRTDGTYEVLSSTGLIIGIDPHSRVTCETVGMAPGDRLVIVTDGLIEAVSSESEQFGRDRLVELFVRHRDDPLEVFCDAVLRTVHRYSAGGEQHDDMTLLAVEYEAAE